MSNKIVFYQTSLDGKTYGKNIPFNADAFALDVSSHRNIKMTFSDGSTRIVGKPRQAPTIERKPYSYKIGSVAISNNAEYTLYYGKYSSKKEQEIEVTGGALKDKLLSLRKEGYRAFSLKVTGHGLSDLNVHYIDKLAESKPEVHVESAKPETEPEVSGNLAYNIEGTYTWFGCANAGEFASILSKKHTAESWKESFKAQFGVQPFFSPKKRQLWGVSKVIEQSDLLAFFGLSEESKPATSLPTVQDVRSQEATEIIAEIARLQAKLGKVEQAKEFSAATNAVFS